LILNSTDMNPKYYHRLNNYFPEQEMKHPRHLEDLVEEQSYYHKVENTDYIALYAVFADFLFLDYLLVNANTRGKGIGSHALKSLKAHERPIILEVEEEDENHPDTILRRQFYSRHGFRVAHGVQYRRKDKEGQSFQMDILYWTPDVRLTDTSILRMMAKVCHKVHNQHADRYYDALPADPDKVLSLVSAH